MENCNNNNQKMARRNEYGLFEPLFNSFFDYPVFKEENTRSLFKTDIKEYDDKYEFEMEAAGLEKKDINLELENGYLTVSANKKQEENKTDNKGRIITQERFTGSYKRSFFIGEDIKQEDISASLNNGILKLNIKKPVHENTKKMIEIQ